MSSTARDAVIIGMLLADCRAVSPTGTDETSKTQLVAAEPASVHLIAAEPSSARPAPEPTGLAATWVSPRCRTRLLERWIGFGPDGTVAGAQVINPVPPTASISWRGTYKLEGNRIRVALESAGAPSGDILVPKELEWDAEHDSVVEISAGERCVFQRDKH